MPGNEYEEERAKRIRENELLLASMGLTGPSLGFERKEKKFKQAQRNYSSIDAANLRHSQRADRSPSFSYSEASSKDSYRQPAVKKYIRGHGDSCHQCRTKTTLKKIQCTAIVSSTGMRCPKKYDAFCLLKYNQILEEVIDDPDWTCPVCCGHCDCSSCRIKRGLVPYGSAWYKIQALSTRRAYDLEVQTNHEAFRNRLRAPREISDSVRENINRIKPVESVSNNLFNSSIYPCSRSHEVVQGVKMQTMIKNMTFL
ncbi:hypothetical protein BDF14DRAFT_1851625 [Spinellus fusiger]|nr:hypothetical protein BDF14DRAFT_1851625 [Spinellus fusiger]